MKLHFGGLDGAFIDAYLPPGMKLITAAQFYSHSSTRGLRVTKSLEPPVLVPSSQVVALSELSENIRVKRSYIKITLTT